MRAPRKPAFASIPGGEAWTIPQWIEWLRVDSEGKRRTVAPHPSALRDFADALEALLKDKPEG